MHDNTHIANLIKSSAFRKKVGAYFHRELQEPLKCEPFDSGWSKVVWKISSPELPRSFLVKEIYFPDPLNFDDSSTNLTLNLDEALYEAATIRAIQRIPALSNRFPRSLGVFAASHPVEEEKLKGQVVSVERLKRIHQQEEKGVSMFIAEELVHGREPNRNELEEAKQIRAEGMKTNPRVWLTVDCGKEDIRVRDDNSLVFLDVGNVTDLTSAEQSTLRQFMRTEKAL